MGGGEAGAVSVETKTCRKCGGTFPEEAFYKRQSKCKKCTKEYVKGHYLKHRESILAYAKEYSSKNKERVKERLQKYRDEHKEELRRVYREKYANETAEQRASRRRAGKKYAQKNPERIKGYYLKYTYGLNLDEYQALLESQDNKCAICQTIFSPERSLEKGHVDHCHTNGHVRGLLCQGCNTGLGYFRDSPSRLASAIDYLKRTAEGPPPCLSNARKNKLPS